MYLEAARAPCEIHVDCCPHIYIYIYIWRFQTTLRKRVPEHAASGKASGKLPEHFRKMRLPGKLPENFRKKATQIHNFRYALPNVYVRVFWNPSCIYIYIHVWYVCGGCHVLNVLWPGVHSDRLRLLLREPCGIHAEREQNIGMNARETCSTGVYWHPSYRYIRNTYICVS